jgi:hypothetical protein
VSIELLEREYDVVALGRTNPQDLAAWAAARRRGWSFAPFDLLQPSFDALPREAPDVLVCAAGVLDGSPECLMAANYLAVARLIETTSARMPPRGRIGVFLPQNARLGLPGLAPYSAAYAALWTWAEAFRAPNITLTRVIPPRATSPTQQALAARSGKHVRTHRPEASSLVDAILAGQRTAGRRPWLAALSTALR